MNNRRQSPESFGERRDDSEQALEDLRKMNDELTQALELTPLMRREILEIQYIILSGIMGACARKANFGVVIDCERYESNVLPALRKIREQVGTSSFFRPDP